MDFTLNGSAVSVDVRPGASLLDVLREDLGVTSVKDGCAPEGSCGACTVLIDGKAVVSCAQKAERAAGRQVMTQEGLPPEERDRWADGFVVSGASQCGFCSPGIVMKAEGLLAKNPSPSREEIGRSLAGNLCRCTGYIKIVDAVEMVARSRLGEPMPHPDLSGRIGSRTARYQGRELALGDKPYVNDLSAPGMLHGALRFSDHPRARVVRIDAGRARAHPGVVAVLLAGDVPGQRVQGAITKDWPQIVAEGEITRYVGDVLAVVVAESRHDAREAAELIDVEYEVLEPVTDPFEALEPDAPRLHESGNVLSTSIVRRGDVDAGLQRSTHVLTETFRTQFIEHAFLEPESALAVPQSDGTLHVSSQGQGVWEDRHQIASFLGWPEERVRVTQVANGGAFGAKEDLNVQCHAALAAVATGRPVLLTMSRAESIRFHPKRHPLTMTYTVGCDDEGRLTAVRARIVGDTGAYASVGDKVLERAAGHACGAYRFDAVDIESTAVYTNNPPAGAMRGFGVNQVVFAIDGMLDRLAERVGIDPWEMRWRNALDVGEPFGTGQVLGEGVGIKACLEAVRDEYRDAKHAGIGCGVKNTGIGNGLIERGRAILRAEVDGTVTLFHSWTEMGQGVHTALLQIVCEELGLTADRVHVVVDTMRELDTGQTTASRSTVLGGRAIQQAATALKAELNGNRIEDLAGREFHGEVVVDWTNKPGEDVANPVTHFAYSWAVQVVILDDDGRIERVVAAHDVGRAINPTLIEGQVEGAVHMGLGFALTEEFAVEGGFPSTNTLKSLGIIPAPRMPDVETIVVEVAQPEGPYGAKGVGEIGLVPTAAAVAGALKAFDGRWRTQLPMRDSAAAVALVPKLAGSARRIETE
ncbi:MAG TPA: selenium-dependent xanthine dehydrogenase [Actinomycetota bacterium]|nr:selenium-dependent xanthine dehydrogenase [Actinomycetota bacterium]